MTTSTRLASIRAALDQHNLDCPVRAVAILLHPNDIVDVHSSVLWGVPVVSDDRCNEGTVRIECEGGSAWQIEDELDEYIERTELELSD